MSTGSEKTSLSYKDAGVDIDAGNALVERIKGVAKRTARPEVMGGLGGFGALCELPAGYKQPVLVSGTDGVGTKLRLAMDLKKHDYHRHRSGGHVCQRPGRGRRRAAVLPRLLCHWPSECRHGR